MSRKISFNISISRTFYRNIRGLDPKVHVKCNDLLDLMADNPFHDRLHWEKVTDDGIYTTRVDDSYRLVWIHVKPDDVVICFVDKHDEAYRRAKRLVLTLDNGVPIIKDILEIDLQSDRPPRSWHVGAFKARHGKLFEHKSDLDLLDAGVTPELIPAVRVMNYPNDLSGIIGSLPDQVVDSLHEMVIEAIDRSEIVPKDKKISEALQRYDGGHELARFVDSEEFRRALEGTLEDWMLFLAPPQKRLVRKHFDTPARVRGIAGSGKTVVAIHRVWMMARNLVRYPEHERVLFLTYGNKLPEVIKELLRHLTNNDPKVKYVECRSIHSWCYDMLKRQGRKPNVDKDRQETILHQAIQQTKPQFPNLKLWERPLDFFAEEISYRIKGHGATTWDVYQTLPGTGRGTPLGITERQAVFSVYQAYDVEMNSAGLSDYDDYILDTLKFVKPEEHVYRYVGAVVDEIQDLSESTIKLIRNMVIPGPNDLFLVGDGTQRIYKGGFALSKVGINISRQSGAILRYNYRNTRQIMHLAEWLIEDASIDDLDDEETSRPPKPDTSIRDGENPTLQVCNSPQQEIQRIAEEIIHLKQSRNYDERDFAILYRTGAPYKELARDMLGKHIGTEVVELDRSANSYFGPGIKLTTFHSAKGLEFKVVFIVGLSDERLPFFHDGKSGMSAKEIEHHVEAERRLLYVAVTRARDLLYLSYSPLNEPSRFIVDVPEEIVVKLA